jgi:hypothetical protein
MGSASGNRPFAQGQATVQGRYAADIYHLLAGDVVRRLSRVTYVVLA